MIRMVKKMQFFVPDDFPIDDRDARLIMLNLKSLMKYCTFSKQAKAIYESVKYKERTLKGAFEKLMSEEE
jgi:hypothetical protein